MAPSTIATLLSLLSLTAAQQIGRKAEVHPRLTTQKCTRSGGCVSRDTAVVLDSLYRPIVQVDRPRQSCHNSSGEVDPNVCDSVESCAESCALNGADYPGTGVWTNGNTLTMRQYVRKKGVLTHVSPRVYLLDESGENYEMLQLNGQELTFDVDMADLPCGMNAALYLGEMEADGGRSTLNPAGATYGTGYCDAQCFVKPWFNGKLNEDRVGACCNEMDVWEANSRSTALVPHSCNITGIYGCQGAECTQDGVCDKPGCGFNPYKNGRERYYGLGDQFRVKTNRRMTVVTQFVTGNGRKNGRLVEIRRFYIQDGRVIQNARVKVPGIDHPVDSIDANYCTNNPLSAGTQYMRLGGHNSMGGALARGVVLTFSIWNDAGSFMSWLDGQSTSAGPCDATEGDPDNIRATYPDTYVSWSNVKWGDIGSTTGALRIGNFE